MVTLGVPGSATALGTGERVAGEAVKVKKNDRRGETGGQVVAAKELESKKCLFSLCLSRGGHPGGRRFVSPQRDPKRR